MLRFFGSQPDEDDSAAPMTTTQPPSLYDQARVAMGLQPTVREELINGMCPTLTFQQRLYGFAICFCVGCVISMTSVLSFANPVAFGIKYSVGNLIALLSTGFLMGPKTQLKRMSHPTRWMAALVYVLAIAATLVFCFVQPRRMFLVLLCIVVQCCAMFWYCLSYIPFGRKIVMSCCQEVAM
ncbi:hypothetical protein AB1Y20_004180 [Prymnesium parvum]|uniref:Vesicle transport protein n=1 Tax=Prymnesium parvum TaxID=97485 RepID=A0AB34J9R1_PRYPA|mmetsp:Transcript_25035/g.60490  ORF Transcript_25035/g.60490 Transcript_25035/m.60490 type:complete len:182 (+) Transcript_25035:26-571(+)